MECILAWQKKWIFSRHFCIYRPNPCAYRADFFHFREIWKMSIQAQISKLTRFSRFCRNLPILRYDGADIRRFRKILKNQVFRYFGPQIFRSIFAICSIFSDQNARNLIFPKVFENSSVGVHHTSKWAKSDRISLMWLKLKFEHSQQKQHFLSHFKQLQLKMRCKSCTCVYFVARTLET